MSTDSTSAASPFSWPFGFSWQMPGSSNAPQFIFAPERLWQPLNPGWSFGNFIVNQQNSSAPEVEQALVSRISYGKQIGRMMEALEVLIKITGADPKNKAIEAFSQLAAEVKTIKQEASHKRLARLREEIDALREQDPPAWQALSTACASRSCRPEHRLDAVRHVAHAGAEQQLVGDTQAPAHLACDVHLDQRKLLQVALVEPHQMR
jgi:hypothetical protein